MTIRVRGCEWLSRRETEPKEERGSNGLISLWREERKQDNDAIKKDGEHKSERK